MRLHGPMELIYKGITYIVDPDEYRALGKFKKVTAIVPDKDGNMHEHKVGYNNPVRMILICRLIQSGVIV